jgi:hypothetical protein
MHDYSEVKAILCKSYVKLLLVISNLPVVLIQNCTLRLWYDSLPDTNISWITRSMLLFSSERHYCSCWQVVFGFDILNFINHPASIKLSYKCGCQKDHKTITSNVSFTGRWIKHLLGILRIYSPTKIGKRPQKYSLHIVSPEKDIGLNIDQLRQDAQKRYHFRVD